jgi:hypothetical protein
VAIRLRRGVLAGRRVRDRHHRGRAVHPRQPHRPSSRPRCRRSPRSATCQETTRVARVPAAAGAGRRGGAVSSGQRRVCRSTGWPWLSPTAIRSPRWPAPSSSPKP